MAKQNSISANSTSPLGVAGGGTGIATTTAYSLVASGTTATGAFQNVSVGTSGQILRSSGAGVLPAWSTATFPATAGTSGALLRSNGTNWVNTTSTFADTYSSGAILFSSGANNVTSSSNFIFESGVFRIGATLGITNGQSIGDGATTATFAIGQGTSNFAKFEWVYDATPSNAYLNLQTNAGSNSILIQKDGGKAIFANTALALYDTAANNTVTFKINEDQAANRILNWVLGASDRTITLTGNPTLADWFDQSVKQAASPTFAALTLTAALTVPNGGTGLQTTTAYGLITGGTTATGAFQNAGTGTTGQVYVSGGAAALGTWTTLSSIGVTTAQGTANQVLVNGTSGTPTSGAITLTLPQSIATTSTPRFAALGINVASSATALLTMSGTINGATSLNGIVMDQTMTHTAGGTELFSINNAPKFGTPTATTFTTCDAYRAIPQLGTNVGTLTTVTGFHAYAYNGTAGTVTNTYGGYFENPGVGTNQVALYAKNLAVGVLNTAPPTDGAIIAGAIYQASDSTGIYFGAGQDSRIFYDGTNSFWDLQAVGTGRLGILCNSTSNLSPVYIEQSGTGDAGLQFTLTGVQNYAIGIDNSDSDKLKICTTSTIGTGDAVVCTTAGQITLPAQPCFLAYCASDKSNVTGDGTVYQVVFDTESFDVSSNFNAGTGVFTAPVTGKYRFEIAILPIGQTTLDTNGVIKLVTTSASYEIDFQTLGLGVNVNTKYTGSILVSMTATDTAYVSFQVSGSTKTVSVAANAGNPISSYFSGKLEC